MTTLQVSTKREFKISDEYRYNQAGSVRWIVSHLLRYKRYIASFVVTGLFVVAVYSAIPYLAGMAFDQVLQETPDRQRFLTFVLIILGIVLLRGAFYLLKTFSIEMLSQSLERDVRKELYLNLLGKSQTFHNRQRVGDIMARATNDVSQLKPMMMPGIDLIFDSLTGLIIPLVFIALIRLDLLLTPFFFNVAFLFALRRYMRNLGLVVAKTRRQFGTLNAGLAEAITGIEVVKATAQEQQEYRKFVQDANRFRNLALQEGHIQARYTPVLLLGIARAGAFLHGLFLFLNHQLLVGELVAYVGLIEALSFPTAISAFTFSLVQRGLAGAERILSLMREETELDENELGHRKRIEGQIVFESVTFGYDGTVVLRDISFRAEPGQTIAIVGRTGSGKSTLTKLVNRIYDVTSGRVLVDGIDVREWNLDSLRSQITTIEQDVFLFSRTVAENIAFGLGARATQPAIEQVARQAQAHNFVTRFQEGYGTVVGERGVTLSGGQRQRIAIARALLTDPPILIMDDSTSAIDSATEDEIQKAIWLVSKGRTTLLITHRLSQIRLADKILLLSQGELIDQGTHAELLERSDTYRRIFASYEN